MPTIPVIPDQNGKRCAKPEPQAIGSGLQAPKRMEKDGGRYHLRPLFTEGYACLQVCKSFFYLSIGWAFGPWSGLSGGQRVFGLYFGNRGGFWPLCPKIGHTFAAQPVFGLICLLVPILFYPFFFFRDSRYCSWASFSWCARSSSLICASNSWEP